MRRLFHRSFPNKVNIYCLWSSGLFLAKKRGEIASFRGPLSWREMKKIPGSSLRWWVPFNCQWVDNVQSYEKYYVHSSLCVRESDEISMWEWEEACSYHFPWGLLCYSDNGWILGMLCFSILSRQAAPACKYLLCVFTYLVWWWSWTYMQYDYYQSGKVILMWTTLLVACS